METLPSLNGATIIDVRNDWEFDTAHVEGALNIPLYDIPGRIKEIESLPKPIILCCASGNRSGQATTYLKQQGFTEVYNGGSWLTVNGLKVNQG